MALRGSKWGNAYYSVLERLILPAVSRLVSTPDGVTVAGTLLAAAVPAAFSLHPAAGTTVLALSGVADSLDGLLARKQGRGTTFGAFLDSTLDRASDSLYLLGFWVLFWKEDWLILSGCLVFCAVVCSFLISYIKARAESLGVQCGVGIMDRTQRTLYLLGWGLLVCIAPQARQGVLWGGLILFVCLTVWTVAQRMQHVRRELDGR